MAGGINSIMKNALRTNWALTDDFQFTMYNRDFPLSVSANGITKQDVFDMAVLNVDLPQLGSDVESVMQGGEWRIYNAKFQPFTFSVTFKDFGGLELRNYFSFLWMEAQRGYYDSVKSSITMSIAGKVAFSSDDCLITAVSQVQLDNSNSQIIEFTVEFSSPYYSNWQISKFGTANYSNISSGKISSITTALDGVGIDASGFTEGVNILDGISNIASKLGQF